MRAASPREAKKKGVGGSQWLLGDLGDPVNPPPDLLIARWAQQIGQDGPCDGVGHSSEHHVVILSFLCSVVIYCARRCMGTSAGSPENGQEGQLREAGLARHPWKFGVCIGGKGLGSSEQW